MKTLLLLASAGLLATAASAQPAHRAHRHVLRAGAAAPHEPVRAEGRDPSGFNAGAAQVPPPGYYDGYQGPGSTVLKRGNAAQYEPGATEEIAPGAKQTATGGPVGGVPGFGGGM